MKRIDIVVRAARNLKQAKGRTFLTALAIAIGAFTIMMSLAAGAGTREYTQNLIESNIDPRTLMVSKGKDSLTSNSALSSLQEYDSQVKVSEWGSKLMSQADIDKIASRDDVESVTPSYNIKVDWAQFETVDKKYVMPVSLYDTGIVSDASAGKMPKKGVSISRDQIVLPESFVKAIGRQPSEMIGKKVTIAVSSQAADISDEEMMSLFMSGGEAAVAQRMRGEEKQYTLTVLAVSKADSSKTMMTGGDTALIDEKLAYELAEFSTKGTDAYQQYFAVVVKVKDSANPAAVRDSLKSQDYDAMTAEDMQQMIFQFVNVLQYIVSGFGVLALIASIFGIINTQYISVLERTSQIGLMKALGMPNRGVGKLFRYEAAWIGFLGGVIGVALTWVAVYFLNPWINEALKLGEGNFLLKFEWLSAGLLVIGLILVAILAGWLPSRRAAKLDPIEALRTE